MRQYNDVEESVLLQEKKYLEPKTTGLTYLEWLMTSKDRPGCNIEIVNKHNQWRRAGIWIDGRSLLGSPFRVHRDGTPEEIVLKYLTWLRLEYIKKGKVFHAFMDLVLHPHDMALLCWCDPAPCHGHVLRHAILSTRKALAVVTAQAARRPPACL